MIVMNIEIDFPEKPRAMTDSEGRKYFNCMVEQIQEYNPDAIIAVARSGFSYAGWTAQLLDLPLGAYWPDTKQLVLPEGANKVVFVDDNMVKGDTYLEAKEFLKTHPALEYQWAVFFTDWTTPEEIRSQIIQGIRLPYFSTNGYWGRMFSDSYGSSTPHVKFREL